MLRGLSAKKQRYFYETQKETVREVLFETKNKDGYLLGFTENYVKTRIPYVSHQKNTLQKVQLTEIDPEGFYRVTILR